MFTGIVQALGHLRQRQARGGDYRMVFDAGTLDLGDVALGDSIAVSGVCLTVVALSPPTFAVDVSRETLERSILADLGVGSAVNLEKALRLSDRLGGHLVAGHVDGVGTVREAQPSGRSIVFRIAAPAELRRYIAAKGSICVDGISLTVNALEGETFSLNLIPHTLEQTTAREWRGGQRVNLEVDLLARYLEQLMVRTPADGVESRITPQWLAAKGFPQ
ncbi:MULTISPECIES: riboflavin synthase [Acidithiobacillus]|nr:MULTISPECIES: riboflavin synthase [Acidithiobacillus]AUW31987.1 riboflavin synthase [Acidithiobacillus caldus]MBU2728409.1 riboflavin synthase [Acidithiobacillus caldus]MBU2734847.1 riboflavin synthase [Acidithiobacillus caldus ATCC 51756]MBU2745786.1 riboflavin synthase [Acidithiobacillus caldus]MBU2763023.1 riboflavin synthase [Acidithiobacillus caldus]